MTTTRRVRAATTARRDPRQAARTATSHAARRGARTVATRLAARSAAQSAAGTAAAPVALWVTAIALVLVLALGGTVAILVTIAAGNATATDGLAGLDPSALPATASAPVRAAAAANVAGFTGEHRIEAVQVCLAEASCLEHGPDNLVGVTQGCPGGSRDRGAWQINSCYHAEVSDACAYSYVCAAQAAFRISNQGTDWSQWTTWGNGRAQAQRATAEAAVAQLDTIASTTATPSVGAPNGLAATAVTWALRQVDTPYQWGGTGPETGGFDCSGLVWAAYQQAGLPWQRLTAADQYALTSDGLHGSPVLPNQVQPGDLVFFAHNPINPATIHHVGIYIGNGQMVDAPHTGALVRVESARLTSSEYLGATRLSTP